MRLIISGGGTGGHIYPAIAIADELKRKNPDAQILFVGAEGKMEMSLVPKAGYMIKGLPIKGLQRKLTLKNLSLPVLWWKSIRRASRIIRSFKPDVAVGVGGYASAPLLWQAQRKDIPTLIQEQNRYAGLSNRWLGKKADVICTAYTGMDEFFPKKKIVLTGNPIRKQIGENKIEKRKEAESFFDWKGSHNKKTILVFGGSLGARTLNEVVRSRAELIRSHPEIRIIWQVGKRYLNKYISSPTATLSNVKLLPFIDRMDLAYSIADLAICRAGALTISELQAAGLPAILIPSPHVSGDHQTYNAMALQKNNAGIMITDATAPEKALQTGIELVKDTPSLVRMRENMKKLYKPDAAGRIVDEIIKLKESDI